MFSWPDDSLSFLKLSNPNSRHNQWDAAYLHA